jgi:hypothetical protein
MPPACPVGWRAPFLEFVQASGRTPGQHPRRSTEAARLHRHGDELWLDRRQETGRGRRPEKRASTPEATRPALRALVAFRRGAMAHKSRALAVGAVQPWRDHRGSLSDRWFCATQTPIKKSRSTELKHLRFIKRRTSPGLGFGSCRTARRTLQGYEAMQRIRKGQVASLAQGDFFAQNSVLAQMFGLVA